MPVPQMSMPPTTARTSWATICWAQACDRSGLNCVLQVTSSIGWPSTPSSSVLMKSIAVRSAAVSSGNAPAAPVSWLIVPIRIGLPRARVGTPGQQRCQHRARRGAGDAPARRAGSRRCPGRVVVGVAVSLGHAARCTRRHDREQQRDREEPRMAHGRGSRTASPSTTASTTDVTSARSSGRRSGPPAVSNVATPWTADQIVSAASTGSGSRSSPRGRRVLDGDRRELPRLRRQRQLGGVREVGPRRAVGEHHREQGRVGDCALDVGDALRLDLGDRVVEPGGGRLDRLDQLGERGFRDGGDDRVLRVEEAVERRGGHPQPAGEPPEGERLDAPGHDHRARGVEDRLARQSRWSRGSSLPAPQRGERCKLRPRPGRVNAAVPAPRSVVHRLVPILWGSTALSFLARRVHAMYGG